MNKEATPWAELLDVLNEEDLIRLSYRLHRAGKYLTSFALDHELALRKTQRTHLGGATPPPVTPQDAPGSTVERI